jgi:hypothetical protein
MAYPLLPSSSRRVLPIYSNNENQARHRHEKASPVAQELGVGPQHFWASKANQDGTAPFREGEWDKDWGSVGIPSKSQRLFGMDGCWKAARILPMETPHCQLQLRFARYPQPTSFQSCRTCESNLVLLGGEQHLRRLGDDAARRPRWRYWLVRGSRLQ